MAYIAENWDNPTYRTRQDLNFGAITAGSAGVTSKFVLFAQAQLYSLSASLQTLGTSTYTANGTNTLSAQQINVIIISNTNTSTGSVALNTTTIGPFLVGGSYNSGGTGTAQVNSFNQFPLNTAGTGTAGFGGVPCPAGSVIYCVSGTDATAVSSITLDYQISRQAPVVQ